MTDTARTQRNADLEYFASMLSMRRRQQDVIEVLVTQIKDIEDCRLDASSYIIRLIVTNLKELRSVRRQLKAIFPDYRDKLDSISPLGSTKGYASYRIEIGDTNVDRFGILKIDLEAPIENFPVKLKSGCGFKKVTVSPPAYETWSYVCEEAKNA